MVANPDVCRLNGAKSNGPRTKRGKAIASRNATKHGLLAQQPPLLASEDLSTFEGLVQGLIDHYQPDNPVAHFLVQQVAMGMMKQHRLWHMEAAIANQAILAIQMRVRFPDVVTPPKQAMDTLLEDYVVKRTPLKEVLLKEKQDLEDVITMLNYDLNHAGSLSTAKTLQGFQESLKTPYPHEAQPPAAYYQHREQFNEWLLEAWDGRKQQFKVTMTEAIARIQQLMELARERIVEVEQTIAEIVGIEGAIAQSEIQANSLQQAELFSRYQRDINRDLYEAIERLEALRQRKHEGSMGSFR